MIQCIIVYPIDNRLIFSIRVLCQGPEVDTTRSCEVYVVSCGSGVFVEM